jgi:thiol-disulfide isomerase/thioredoxin
MKIWIIIITAIAVDFAMVAGQMAIFSSTHKIIPLALTYQVITALWAGWDSSRIHPQRYQTRVSAHPVVLALLVGLFWIIVFPMYLFARFKIVTGQTPLKGAEGFSRNSYGSSNADTSGKSARYVLRLAGFTLVSLLLGGVVLFCMFAPRINPSFINGFLFRTKLTDSQRAHIDLLASPAEQKILDPIFDTLNSQLSSADFKKLGITQPQDVQFQTKDGVPLHGWYFANAQAKKTANQPDTVLFSTDGIYGMKFPVLLGYIKLLQDANFSTFIYNYRGYESSKVPNKDKPDTQTVISDGDAAYDYLVNKRKIDPARLILMGNKLGAYVSCQISANHPCAGMVLEDPWIDLKQHVDSSMAVAMRMIPLAMYPGDGLNNLKVLEKKHPPVLIATSSMSDGGAYEIYESIPTPKTLVRTVEFDVANFTDLPLSRTRYLKKLGDFLHPGSVAANAAPHTKEQSNSKLVWLNNLEEASASAKAKHKMVLVDFYTTWCGPCKMMDRETYSDPAIEQCMNQGFVPVKINAEDAKYGEAVATKYGITGYPTMLVLDGNGKVVDKVRGYAEAKPFLTALQSITQ